MLKLSVARHVRSRATMSVCVAAVLALAACGAGESSSGSSGRTSSSDVDAARAMVQKYSSALTSYPEVEPVSGDVSSLAGKTVWYVPIGAATPSLRLFGEGMADALKNVDVDVHVCDGKFVPTAIAACLEQAGNSGADAVVTGYFDYQLVPAAIDGLVAKGVPVLVAGAAAPEGKSNSPELAFDDTTEAQNLAQELTADAVIADSDGKANVLYLGVTDSPALKGTADHTVDFFAKRCPTCSVTRLDYNTASIDKVASQVSAALIKAPKTDYIVAELDTVTPLAANGAQSAGFANKVKFAATGADVTSLQRIAAGDKQFANTGFGGFYGGWRFADGIVRMLTGGVPVSEGAAVRVFTKDNIEGLDLTPAGFASNDWFGDNSFEDTFLGAWGVK